MGKADTGIEQVGGEYPDLRPDILGCGSVGPVVWFRDMGDDASHQEGVGWITPQGGPQAYREATSEREVRSVDIPPTGGRDGRSRTIVGGDLCIPPPENGHTVHCNKAHYGPVSGGGADTGANYIQVVVGTGWGACGRDADGGLRGRTGVGGRGDGQDGDGDGFNWW